MKDNVVPLRRAELGAQRAAGTAPPARPSAEALRPGSALALAVAALDAGDFDTLMALIPRVVEEEGTMRGLAQ